MEERITNIPSLFPFGALNNLKLDLRFNLVIINERPKFVGFEKLRI